MIETVRRTSKNLLSHLSMDHIGDHEEANRRSIGLQRHDVPIHRSRVDVGEREMRHEEHERMEREEREIPPFNPFRASTPTERYQKVVVGPSAFSSHFANPFPNLKDIAKVKKVEIEFK